MRNNSSVGRTAAFQTAGNEFKPHLLLKLKLSDYQVFEWGLNTSLFL